MIFSEDRVLSRETRKAMANNFFLLVVVVVFLSVSEHSVFWNGWFGYILLWIL